MDPRAVEFAERVRERYGLDVTVEEFEEGTGTAADAAAAVGCDVARIASTLVFAAGDDFAVVVTSGANRVSEDRLADYLGVPAASVSMPSPGAVREAVGWSVGGVPPLAHERDLPTYIDETLLGYETVWAAAGTPRTVFEVAPETLRDLAGATPVDVVG